MQRPTLLLVDDDLVSLQLLIGILGKAHHCLCATNGEEMLALLANEAPPDLVVLDLHLPDIDGFELCRRIKADERFSSVPVIIVTAAGHPENEVRALSVGANDFLTKPFSAAVALARIKTHLRLKEQTELLERMAWLDALTGLPNRRRFDAALEQMGRRAVREQLSLAALVIDIDVFKAFNDNYGHGAGDECLRQVADALKESLSRPVDLLARHGGEEFAVLLADTNRSGALEMAERMRAAVERLAITHDYSVAASVVTVSIGAAALVPASMADVATLLEEADRCLYKAKKTGRNRAA